MSTKFMMATKAGHSQGDLSRSKPDICVVYEEDDDNYIGNWVTGFGFVQVKFPKATTRELTPEEIEQWHGTPIGMGDMISFINLKGEKLGRQVNITKQEDGSIHSGRLMSPLKIGSFLYIDRGGGHYFRTTNIKQVVERMGANSGFVVKTKNSTYTVEYAESDITQAFAQ